MQLCAVAPFTGAWIEIKIEKLKNLIFTVAPFTGAWIEMWLINNGDNGKLSLPSRGRGLKFHQVINRDPCGLVAPFTGAWIEIERDGF